MRKWRVIVVIDGRWMETQIQAQDQTRAWVLARQLFGAKNVQNVIEIR
jgi:hypothetical protein